MHAPVIDLDYGTQLWPTAELMHSSQANHHHLYINKPIQADLYWDMLKAMANAGIVEPGYCDASINRGYSAVRNIGEIKPGVNVSIAEVLQENNRLKRELFTLRAQLGIKNQSTGIEISIPETEKVIF